MRKLVVALTISTLAFAGTTVYLARELAAVRAAAGGNTVPVLAGAAATSTMTEAAPVAPANSATGVAGKNPLPPDMKAQARAWIVAQIPSMREQLEDPEKRAAAMRDNRTGFRRGFPHLAAHLGLTDDEYSRLANLLAEQQMRIVEARYQCAIKPDCDDMTAANALEPGFNQELVDLLGSDKKQKFDDYRDNAPERRTVAYLRGELPDSHPMTDAQAERLTSALGDERRRILQEWEQRGASNSGGFINARGSIYYSSNAQSVEQRLAEAGEFQQRLRARAAQVLNTEQLKLFTQIQEDLLDGMRQGWEYEAQSAKKP